VIGCGNIGSFLVLLLIRVMEIVKITLVDFDRYEESNFCSQHIAPSDFGKPKARVLARLARRLNPRLQVVPIVSRLELAPPGLLRGDLILACLDSKESRRCANALAFGLGIPLVDAGIEASASLARVNVYLPSPGQPCLECAWDQRDYAALPVIHPCAVNGHATPPTGAPACLGALAASLQAIECKKILAGDFSSAGRQILIEAAAHRHFLTGFRFNPQCRCPHKHWDISKRRVPLDLPLSQALKLAGRGRANLGFAGMQLARQLACPGCGFARRVVRLDQRLNPREKKCPRCGRELLVSGFHSQARLNSEELDPALAARSLARLGLRAGDFISVNHGGNEIFFELAAARSPHNRRIP